MNNYSLINENKWPTLWSLMLQSLVDVYQSLLKSPSTIKIRLLLSESQNQRHCVDWSYHLKSPGLIWAL